MCVLCPLFVGFHFVRIFFITFSFGGVYVEIQELVLVDPLLLQSFLYICPEGEYGGVFKVIAPSYAMARLGHHCAGRTAISKHDEVSVTSIHNYTHITHT